MWHIGQKVVCVKHGRHRLLVLDKIYTIKSIDTCKCGVITLDVGIMDYVRIGTVCYKCNFLHQKGSIVWCMESKFIPLDDYCQMEKLVEEIIKPQLIEA